jgi:hypothetical protein
VSSRINRNGDAYQFTISLESYVHTIPSTQLANTYIGMAVTRLQACRLPVRYATYQARAYRARQLPLAQKSAQNLVPIFGTKPIFTLVPIIGTRQVKKPRPSLQPPYPLETACADEWSYQFLPMSTNTTIFLSNAVILVTAVAQGGALAVSHFLLLEDEFKQNRVAATSSLGSVLVFQP